MSLTPNYGFNIPTGSDAVNLLTQCYPNFTSLDSILKTIELTGITTATVTKVGTVFQLVRTNSALNVIRFVATGNYVAGDTFTIDGVAVTATSVQGTSLQSGAFVINQSVVCILNQNVLTVLVGGSGSNDASDIDYDNTGSGLAATNVQAAIDEVKADIPSIPATYDADDIVYDNTGSGLAATNVQDAIDELKSLIVPTSVGYSATIPDTGGHLTVSKDGTVLGKFTVQNSATVVYQDALISLTCATNFTDWIFRSVVTCTVDGLTHQAGDTILTANRLAPVGTTYTMNIVAS